MYWTLYDNAVILQNYVYANWAVILIQNKSENERKI